MTISQKIEHNLNQAKKQKEQEVLQDTGLDVSEVDKRKTVLLIESNVNKKTNRQTLDLDAKYKQIFNKIKDDQENALREKEERRRSSAGVGFMNRMRNSLAAGGRSSVSYNYPTANGRKTMAAKIEPVSYKFLKKKAKN